MKPKVANNEKKNKGGVGATINRRGVANITQEHQGVDIRHRGSAIRRLSVTEGCDRGEIARAA